MSHSLIGAADAAAIRAILQPAASPKEVLALVESLVGAGDPVEMRRIRQLLGSELAGAAGHDLEQLDPSRFEEIAAQLDVLGRAASSVSIEQVLNSYGGKPRAALKHLATAAADGLTQSELEQLIGTDSSYASKIVRRLAERNLVLRWSEGRNRRVVISAGGRVALGLHVEAAAGADERVLPRRSVERRTPVFDLVQTEHTAARQRVVPYQASGNRFAQCWSSRAFATAA